MSDAELTVTIKRACTDSEIAAAFPVLRQLRTQLTDAEELTQRVRRQQENGGYELLCALRGTTVTGCAGFRRLESLFANRYLYVDDLVTDQSRRSIGVGKALLDHLVALARTEDREEIHLDSGVQRFDAHRFYLRERFEIRSHHFSLKIEN